MLHIDFPLVHELDEALDLRKGHILHNDDRITFAGIVGEHGVEEGAAGAEDDSVGADELTLAGQGHVAEATAIQKLGEHGLQIAMVVLPPQAVLLRQHGGAAPAAAPDGGVSGGSGNPTGGPLLGQLTAWKTEEVAIENIFNNSRNHLQRCPKLCYSLFQIQKCITFIRYYHDLFIMV